MVVIGINLYFVSNFVTEYLPNHWAVDLAVSIFALLYLGFNLYLVCANLIFLLCGMLLVKQLTIVLNQVC